MRQPVAVLSADVHYNATTLPVADAAMRMAITKANELKVPFVVAGDLHDTKANLRGECIKAMIDTFKTCVRQAYVIVGNHCKINERGEAHSLEFLRPYATIVDCAQYSDVLESYLIPYFSEPVVLNRALSYIVKGSRIIMHQGVLGSNMGHYIQDKSAVPKEVFADYRVISGHYHQAQDIKCGPVRKNGVGLFSYIGNPYSLNFGEANDGPKGFQILYDDGSMEQVATKLRRHRVYERSTQEIKDMVERGDPWFGEDLAKDLVWLKVKGPQSELSKINKRDLGQKLFGHSNFKLDLIATDSAKIEDKTDALKDTELLDMLINALAEPAEEKDYLKKLWRGIL